MDDVLYLGLTALFFLAALAGPQGGRAAVSIENADRARRERPPPRLPRRRPFSSRSVSDMSDTTAGLLQVGALLAALALCYRPLGRLHGPRLHQRARPPGERVVYRVVGVDPRADQRWPVYAASVLAFSFVSVVGLYALQTVPAAPAAVLGFPGVDPALAFNTAASFVTNTNWQSYSGESTMGHLTQMAGLAVQNFVSAAVGIAVAVALVRGLHPLDAPTGSATSGWTWSAASCASCCRSRSSPPSSWSRWAPSRTSRRAPT